MRILQASDSKGTFGKIQKTAEDPTGLPGYSGFDKRADLARQLVLTNAPAELSEKLQFSLPTTVDGCMRVLKALCQHRHSMTGEDPGAFLKPPKKAKEPKATKGPKASQKARKVAKASSDEAQAPKGAQARKGAKALSADKATKAGKGQGKSRRERAASPQPRSPPRRSPSPLPLPDQGQQQQRGGPSAGPSSSRRPRSDNIPDDSTVIDGQLVRLAKLFITNLEEIGNAQANLQALVNQVSKLTLNLTTEVGRLREKLEAFEAARLSSSDRQGTGNTREDGIKVS